MQFLKILSILLENAYKKGFPCENNSCIFEVILIMTTLLCSPVGPDVKCISLEGFNEASTIYSVKILSVILENAYE